jgi:hypothetical protein
VSDLVELRGFEPMAIAAPLPNSNGSKAPDAYEREGGAARVAIVRNSNILNALIELLTVFAVEEADRDG